MPAQLDLTRLSVRQFAERFRSEMIPLSNTFSYFCASVPMTEDDLKEYLQEPVAALPPAMTAALPKISIFLVPYLERGSGGGERKAKTAAGDYISIEKPPEGRILADHLHRLVAVHFRHHNVHQHNRQIRRGFENADGFAAGAGGEYRHAAAFEHAA